MLASLELRYKPDHPDVIRTKSLIEALESQVSVADPVTSPVTLSAAQLQRRERLGQMAAEIESLDRQINFRTGEEKRLRDEIAEYQRRVEAVPGLESEWVALTRDYDTQQIAYKELLTKSGAAKVAVDLEEQQIGEHFRIVDPANVPVRPLPSIRTAGECGWPRTGLVLWTWRRSALGIQGRFLPHGCGGSRNPVPSGSCQRSICCDRSRKASSDPSGCRVFRGRVSWSCWRGLRGLGHEALAERSLSGDSVSRIDEALGRTHGVEQGLSPVAPSQTAFRPAWPITEELSETIRGRDGELRSVSGSPVGFSSAWSQRLVNSPLSDAGLLEQFRRLAGTLHKARRMNGLRSVMVTSATPGDGKTLTAINLALILSGSFNSEVLLVDADLRRPSIPSIVDFQQEAGLSEALSAKNEQKLALVRIAPHLTLLPAGQPIANSIEAVTSPRMQHILSEATSQYDWVILDAPPVGITTDARLLAEFVGGTLLVIRAGKTQHVDIEKALTALGREQILGVVLNGTTGPKEDATYYGEPYPGKKR